MMESDQFTLDEANGLVPWLQETFDRLGRLRQEYVTLQQWLGELERQWQENGGSEDDSELRQARNSVSELARQVEEGVEEILDRGIVVRNVERGLVDFPSQRDGREVYLCWIKGEERIDFWHETDRGFAHREPL
ncbi:MAG TPA: DUF2203 domain-containing protein [Dehalococcoidia bacterium]|nr:hypothetical protein [Chloroflexota bacterium]MQF94661.1 DUF2203 family protein [SAR202 cluster bacterium]HAA95773.1 DUF2203 domain-containing protein [Dehalococcoidia bacterium]HCL25221.1 DUF2203 domain-containing protein [Dehalococcoidia bacterium]|tara:strand:+ start:243 stop:644 length:402 start_codon:yes stop_codon:yes gene_type:complete